MDLSELKKYFGSSNEFLYTVITCINDKQNDTGIKEFADNEIQEARFLASCTYEEESQWGEEVSRQSH